MLKLDEAVLLAIEQEAIGHKADKALGFLQEALDLSGTGVMWPNNAQPSSAEGEYPVAQTHALIDSLDARPSGRLAYDVGSFQDKNAEGYAHAEDLETSPPSRGGRPFVEMALHDPELTRRLT